MKKTSDSEKVRLLHKGFKAGLLGATQCIDLYIYVNDWLPPEVVSIFLDLKKAFERSIDKVEEDYKKSKA